MVRDVAAAEFADAVLARSRERPVVVDFWAPWCGPCRALGPVLERLAEGELRDQVDLVKVNTDREPELAQQYQVRGIPAVKAFRDGQVVAEFVGALPESEVRRFLGRLLPSPADRLAAEAAAAEAAGDPETAERRYAEALAADRGHGPSLLGLGRRREAQGDLEAALDLYQRVPPGGAVSAAAARAAAALELRREAARAGDRKSLGQRLAADPADLEARYALALLAAADGEHRAALEHLLEIVRRDRRFRDDGARRAMLQVFETIGPRSELADEFRSRLAAVLY